jgi:hypothetical protein
MAEENKPIPKVEDKKPLEKKDDKVLPKIDPTKKVENKKEEVKKDEGYKAIPFTDYLAHTATIEGGDENFMGIFKDKPLNEYIKREDEFGKKYGAYAQNRSWYGDMYNKEIGDKKERLGDVALSVAQEQKLDPKTVLGTLMEEGGYKFTYGTRKKYSGRFNFRCQCFGSCAGNCRLCERSKSSPKTKRNSSF